MDFIADTILKELKKIVNKHKSDKLVKQFRTKLICDIFEMSGNEIAFEICDDEQETIVEINGVIYDIAEELKAIDWISDLCSSIGCGDGDEGCVYVTLNANKCEEYINNHKR